MIVGINLRMIGFGIIFLSVVLFAVFYIFTKNTIALNLELHKSCPLPEGVCPYTRSIPAETAVGFTITTLMFGSGLYLVVMEKEFKKSTAEQRDKITKAVKTLEGDEKKVYEIIVASEGFIFQNELIDKLGFSKVKVSRTLDKLEGKGLVERRRRGMSNTIILKH